GMLRTRSDCADPACPDSGLAASGGAGGIGQGPHRRQVGAAGGIFFTGSPELSRFASTHNPLRILAIAAVAYGWSVTARGGKISPWHGTAAKLSAKAAAPPASFSRSKPYSLAALPARIASACSGVVCWRIIAMASALWG